LHRSRVPRRNSCESAPQESGRAGRLSSPVSRDEESRKHGPPGPMSTK
jgi:hypothetical protein